MWCCVCAKPVDISRKSIAANHLTCKSHKDRVEQQKRLAANEAKKRRH